MAPPPAKTDPLVIIFSYFISTISGFWRPSAWKKRKQLQISTHLVSHIPPLFNVHVLGKTINSFLGVVEYRKYFIQSDASKSSSRQKQPKPVFHMVTESIRNLNALVKSFCLCGFNVIPFLLSTLEKCPTFE